MNTTTSSAALVRAGPVFTNTQRLALAGFLTGYSGLTREAYELDLRQYASWCRQHHLRLFEGRRADIECFARDLEGHGRRLRHTSPPRPKSTRWKCYRRAGRPPSPGCAPPNASSSALSSRPGSAKPSRKVTDGGQRRRTVAPKGKMISNISPETA